MRCLEKILYYIAYMYLESGGVYPRPTLHEERCLGRLRALELDEVRLAVNIVNAVHAITSDARIQLLQYETDVEAGETSLHS